MGFASSLGRRQLHGEHLHLRFRIAGILAYFHIHTLTNVALLAFKPMFDYATTKRAQFVPNTFKYRLLNVFQEIIALSRPTLVSKTQFLNFKLL
jgi:hypothetical protein